MSHFDVNHPKHLLNSSGVVHTVTGAMLMLNTDLHIADLNKHMSRADFVRNSLRAVHETIPSADGSSTPDPIRDDGSSVKIASIPSVAPSSVSVRAKPPNHPPNAPRSASAPVVASPAPPSRGDTGSTMTQSARGSSTTVSSFSYSKAWEVEAENALKVSAKVRLH